MEKSTRFTDPNDTALWEIAKKRASFKRHLFSYVVVIGFLWVLWALNAGNHDSRFPWPVWPTLGWGIGVVFHFLGAYVFPRENAVEKEFQKLKNKEIK